MPAPEVGEASLDGWSSVVTGIGDGERDKRMSHHHRSPHAQSYEATAALWETDDMFARAIEAPGQECFREGYEITIGDEGAYADLKELVEDDLEELGADLAVETLLQYENAYGGGAILIGADDGGTLQEPLQLSRIGAVDYLNVLEPIEIVPASYYEDPEASKYGTPEYYQLNPTGFLGPSLASGLGTVAPLRGITYIHESRLIVFGGIRVSKHVPTQNALSQFWGTPAHLRFNEPLRDFGITWSSAGIIATDVSQPIISMEGLMQLVAKEPERVVDRMRALELMRSTARPMLLDAKKEKFERVTTSLTGIPELLDRISQRLAAAIGMPLSVLMGYSPAGLGQPGEAEMTQWYNKIRSLQRRKIGPVIRRIAKMVMQTLRKRKQPKKWRVQWNELVRQSDAERAESRLTQARTDTLYVKGGIARPDEIRRSRFFGQYSYETQVQENKPAPGFIAPLPAGVLPGTVPAAGVVTAVEAGTGKTGQNAHSVTGYARRNPTSSPTGAAATAGGDTAAGKENRDAADAYTAASELTSVREARARARTPGAIALLDELEALTSAEAEACAAGTCGPDCVYDHPGRMDDDGPGRVRKFAGFDVTIESPKGSTREWVDSDGTTGKTKMKYDYGYIGGTLGTDGDSVDVYLGPSPDAPWVYVIHQQSKASDFTTYDEDKCLIGFDSANHARDAYLRQYDDERFLGSMSQMSVEDFRRRLGTRAGAMVSNWQHDAAGR